jgi:hypothetical protein
MLPIACQIETPALGVLKVPRRLTESFFALCCRKAPASLKPHIPADTGRDATCVLIFMFVDVASSMVRYARPWGFPYLHGCFLCWPS